MPLHVQQETADDPPQDVGPLATVMDGESYVDQLRQQRKRLQCNDKLFDVPGYEIEIPAKGGEPRTYHSLRARYRRLKGAEHSELRAHESADDAERTVAFNVGLLEKACIGVYYQAADGDLRKLSDGWTREVAEILDVEIDAPANLITRQVLTRAVFDEEDDTLLLEHGLTVYMWMLGDRDPLKLVEEDDSGNS